MVNLMKEIEAQSDFCMMLLNHLNDDIHNSETSCGSIINHTRMEIDIVRIRRELLTLREMISKGV